MEPVVNSHELLAEINPGDLTLEAPSLFAWELGAVSDAEAVAKFMYRGGPFPPQASARREEREDVRPEKKYWDFVRSEMHAFLCTDDKRYKDLWKQVASLQKKSGTAVVGVIAAFLGQLVGAPATVLAGFVAVCLYAAIKIGKEAYCRYSAQHET
jgi:hypothetical protein